MTAQRSESDAGKTTGAARAPWRRRLGGTGGRRAAPLRRWSVVALVALACIGLLVSTVALWTHTLLFDTDRYVETVAPLGKDPAVTQAVADTVTDETLKVADLENRLREQLPERLQFLAKPLTDEVRTYLNKEVDKFLQTETAYDAWLAVNRNVHAQLVAVLRDKSTVFLVEGDDVKLNLLPLIAYALQLVEKNLPDFLDSRLAIPQIDPKAPYDEQVAALSSALGRSLPAGFGTITLFKNTQVREAQRAARMFDTLVILLWVVTLLLVVAALALSPWRLRTALELGLGVLIAVMLARVAIKQLEEAIVEGVKTEGGSRVAQAIITSAVASLGDFVTWLLVGGLIVAVAAFFGGRPRWLVAAKDGVVKIADRGADLAHSQLPDAQRMATTYFDYLRGGGIVVALVLLFFASGSLAWVTVVMALLVAWELLVWWLGRRRLAAGGGGA